MLGKWPAPDEGLNEQQLAAAKALAKAIYDVENAGLFLYVAEDGIYVDRHLRDMDTELWELDANIKQVVPNSLCRYVYRLSPQQDRLAHMFKMLKELIKE